MQNFKGCEFCKIHSGCLLQLRIAPLKTCTSAVHMLVRVCVFMCVHVCVYCGVYVCFCISMSVCVCVCMCERMCVFAIV